MEKGFVLIAIILFLFINIQNVLATENIEIYNSSNNILYVGGTGPGNYTKIQDALNDSTNGDIVFVYNGFYDENLLIENSISLIGEDKNNTIIRGFSSLEEYEKNKDTIRIKADWVNITGFKIINKTLDLYAGIRIDTKYNKIYGNNFYDKFIAITFSGASSNNTILNNVFKNNYKSISNAKKSENNTIINNKFINDGILLGCYKPSNTIFGNKVNDKPITYLKNISDEIIDNAGQIFLINCDNITIQNQDLSYTKNGVYIKDSEDIIISNNIICNNHKPGIEIYNSNNIQIFDNNFLSNNNKDTSYDAGAIYLKNSINNEINNNYFANNTRSAIYIYRSDFNIVEGNILHCKKENRGQPLEILHSNNNRLSKNVFYNRTVYVKYDSRNNKIDNNTFMDSDLNIYKSDRNQIFFNKFYGSDEKWVNKYDNIKINIFYNLQRKYAIHISGNNNEFFNNDLMSTSLRFNPASIRIYVNNNYWGRPRVFPKISIGHGGPGYTIYYSIDRNPASLPNCNFEGDN